jgi:cell division septum initiation protein DivIVA
MAGIDFDRQAFIPASEKSPRVSSNILGAAILIAAIAIAGFVAYKLIPSLSATAAPHTADSASLTQLQQQLEEMQKRLDTLEKHRKVSSPEPAKESVPSSPVTGKAAPSKPVYRIASGIPQPTANRPAVGNPSAGLATQQAALGVVEAKANANHEAWQATTDRLADVVGVVGSQQGEIAQTREDVNKLLAKTTRSAVPFELRRNANREPIGPVYLVLKNADTKNNKYSVCVYVTDQCIELKDRALNEVVAFVTSKDSAPLALVATKILHDQIVGYLEVPNKPAL